MKQYLVIAECIDVNGNRKYPGESIELDDERYERAKNAGVVGKEILEDEGDAEGLKKLGGGYYELPNGERIRGLEKAQKALQELEEGALNAQTETGETATSGAGDAE